MNSVVKFAKFFALTVLCTTLSCGNDDDNDNNNDDNEMNNSVMTNDLVASVDENPTAGQSIGNLRAIGDGDLTFSITSQNIPGAIRIDSSSGELIVDDASLFDFETNPIISATISVEDASNTNTATATFNLNDVDDIASFLSTSKDMYNTAADGDWITITEAEYNNLARRINDVDKIATSDARYDFNANIIRGTGDFTVSNDNGQNIPSSSYVFAFKYNAQDADIEGSKVLVSDTAIAGTYVQLGGTLPKSVIGDQYFVIKKNTSATTAEGFLAFHFASNIGVKNITSMPNQYAFERGDATNLTETFNDNATFLYQGLSTTQKQW
ncbi:cadherin repeat domain-containing protein [uncultured Algibacter sp.]|uniref:cadherin repeat domain-containing protein n=1 Tax=uncultured Algibacter sp. TaxID=298659 RepID=UPI003217EE6D